MRDRISIVFIFLIIIGSSENLIGQNSLTIKGKISDYEDQLSLPAVKVEAFNKNELVDKTETNLENGSFDLNTTNNIDKIVFSYSYYYIIPRFV